MSTKPAAKVENSSPDSIEAIAYASVSTIPTVEPNDRNRLGYHVWRWLREREGTLERAILESGSRLQIPASQAQTVIAEALKKSGITLG